MTQPKAGHCLTCQATFERFEDARAHYQATKHTTWSIPSSWLALAKGWTVEAMFA